MDIQESVIVIIKNGQKILLQKNTQWNDLSFIGGKAEEEDNNIPINTAYREVEEELGIRKKIDFSLEPLTPDRLEFEKFSKRIQKERVYRIFPFLLTYHSENRELLESSENIWISLQDPAHENSSGLPLSDLVLKTLPILDINNKESFTHEKG